MKSWLPYAGLVAAAVALDQWIKSLVENGLAFQEKVDIVPFLALYRTYNTGVAFSMFSWIGDTGLIVAVAGGHRLRALSRQPHDRGAIAFAGSALR